MAVAEPELAVEAFKQSCGTRNEHLDLTETPPQHGGSPAVTQSCDSRNDNHDLNETSPEALTMPASETVETASGGGCREGDLKNDDAKIQKPSNIELSSLATPSDTALGLSATPLPTVVAAAAASAGTRHRSSDASSAPHGQSMEAGDGIEDTSAPATASDWSADASSALRSQSVTAVAAVVGVTVDSPDLEKEKTQEAGEAAGSVVVEMVVDVDKLVNSLHPER